MWGQPPSAVQSGEARQCDAASEIGVDAFHPASV
jgi:hypothetical protein